MINSFLFKHCKLNMEDCILHKNNILVYKGEDKCLPFFRIKTITNILLYN